MSIKHFANVYSISKMTQSVERATGDFLMQISNDDRLMINEIIPK